jgi:ring-1,2-phenylacetyl-CoA epoxidase subunit PaaE
MKLEITHTSNPTPDSISLYFTKSPGLNYKAGQYGTFSFLINNERVFRTYSFHTSPDVDRDLGITVRRVNSGIVSTHLLNGRFKDVELDGVTGQFIVEASPDIKRHMVMFAGGSGITPMLSMIKTVLYNEPRTTISLIYSNQTFDRIIFRNELFNLEQQYPGRLKVYHVLTKETNVPADFPVYYKDRLSKLIIKKLLKSILAEVNYCIEYYLSGPYEFMKLAEDAIRSLDSTGIRIYKEHFYIPPDPESDFDASKFSTQEVIVRLKEEEKLLTVEAGKSILEASFGKGMRLAHSCKEGQCGVCRAVLISGQVKLRRNHVLTNDELNAGQILLCQGFPVTENVVVQPLN